MEVAQLKIALLFHAFGVEVQKLKFLDQSVPKARKSRN